MINYNVVIDSYDPDTRLSGPSHDFQIKAESAELAVIQAMQKRLIAISEKKDERPEFTPMPMIGLHISLPEQKELFHVG